ncbi:acyltransferase [Hypnocyclicus thermotrophus]|uniref:acyltransferase n=1 Tax=Hypnocyclicus thermotrophus TaxID=1627895 RepID=UPI00106718E3|nr:acyltransferase [Hypnocyclicus thermotrophus]
MHLICADKAEIKIGDNVRFANGFQHIGCSNGIRIGNNVLVAAFVHINDGNHKYVDIDIPIINQGSYSKGKIKIGNNVWIGHSAHILGGVEIGDNVVIGAGAVVTRNIPPFSVAVGNPARVIKKYDKGIKKWIRV